MPTGHAREIFSEIASRPDERIDLAEAALWIAAEEYPGLEVEPYLEQLDELGGEAATALSGTAGSREAVEVFNRFIYGTRGFGGNRADYYDTRNSYLNEVLDRRKGIPITLAIVYLGIARGAGLAVEGVGFPGHFLLKCVEGPETVVDPFTGEILTTDDCAARFQAAVGGPVPFDRRALETTPNKPILARLLGNLKQIYLVKHDFERALAASERILLLMSDAEMPHELRDRGLLYARLECFGAALVDLERFLQLAPADASADTIRGHLDDLARRVPQLH